MHNLNVAGFTSDKPWQVKTAIDENESQISHFFGLTFLLSTEITDAFANSTGIPLDFTVWFRFWSFEGISKIQYKFKTFPFDSIFEMF